MAKPVLPEELWSLIEPPLPPPKPRRFRYPGRKPLDRRKVLTGILFVLRSGSDLKIGIEFSVTVDGVVAQSFEADLKQILSDLGLSDRLRLQ